jgi:hypothetical protein
MTTAKKNTKKTDKAVDVKAVAKVKRVDAAKKTKALKVDAIKEIVHNNVRCVKIRNAMVNVNEIELGLDDLGRKYQDQLHKVFYQLDKISKAMANELYLESTKDAREIAKTTRKDALKQKKLDKIKALEAEIAAMD